MFFRKRIRKPLEKFKATERLVFGGSFDPPHRGHLEIIRHAFAENLCDNLDLVPAAVSPFKQRTPPVSGEDRVRLLELALEDFREELAPYRERIRILDLEIQRDPPSFSSETLKQIRSEFPRTRTGVLIGSDSFVDFERWHRFRDILFHHTLVVFLRRGDDREELDRQIRRFKHEYSNAGPEIKLLNNPFVDCSSSEVRSAVSRGALDHHAVKNCLTPSVRDFIAGKGLYQRKPASAR